MTRGAAVRGAVNYWYDMHFGAAFVLNALVQKLTLELVPPEGAAPGGAGAGAGAVESRGYR